MPARRSIRVKKILKNTYKTTTCNPFVAFLREANRVKLRIKKPRARHTNMNRLLGFYYGGFPDHRGRFLAEITRQDDLWLEVTHD